ncbi:polyphenol oxidase family protein [Candidatus Sumerlaeota bacterium]|nr:polyphenol oxidase family protein [Candidatus Sumerlaeota bacterium]
MQLLTHSIRNGIAWHALGSGVIAGTTLKNYAGENADRMAQLEALRGDLGMEPALIAGGEQAHGRRIETLGADSGDGVKLFPETDGLVTAERGILLHIVTADCVPLLLFDDQAGVIAAVHAGWKGTQQRIVQRAIETMTGLGARPERIKILAGPCICQAHYEVSPEMAAAFAEEFGDGCVEGHRLDLPAVNLLQIRECGVPENGLYQSGLCTWEETALLHSYRRDGQAAGRMITFIVLT